MNNFTEISINGRIAYTIMCAEKYALNKYPNKNWAKYFEYMWDATSSYYDDWYERFIEVLPEYLFEFVNYEESDFEYLDKNEYEYYINLLQDINNQLKELLTIPSKIAMMYAYTGIPGKGDETIDLINKSISILEKAHIELPPIEKVAFSKFSDNNGWGYPIDGKELSYIINVVKDNHKNI